MNRFWIILALTALGLGQAAAATGADPAAVAQVRAGKLTTARAAWWGFDPQDATAALQAAIDSGARQVIVEDMKSPWNTDPLKLASDQELILERGVTIQARRGAYQATGDSLLTLNNLKNATLRGEAGATLRMWRGDYAHAPYRKSEFRHAVSIHGCTGVRITGLTIAESGGDGIYLGAGKGHPVNKDVVIKDVICDRNYRQGISVISADNLLIENTVLRDTSGTAPMAGIDFEPNNPAEILRGVVMRNCVAEGNAGDGFTFYVKHLGATSGPITVRLENCRSLGNRTGFRYSTGGSEEAGAQPGSIEVVGCRFEGSKQAGISLSGIQACGRPFRFEKCEVVSAALDTPKAAPIQLSSSVEDSRAIGGVEFAGCTVSDPLERRPLSYTDVAGGLKLEQVGGALRVEHAGATTAYTLDRKLLETWFPAQAFKDFAPFNWAGVRLAPAAPDARPERGWSCMMRQRGQGNFLIWAEAGQDVAVTLRLGQVGKSGVPRTPVTLTAPSGQSRRLGQLADERDQVLTFKAAETGVYRLGAEPGRATVRVTASSHRVCLAAERKPIHLLAAAGDFYFYVPAGVGEFGVRLSGDGEGESVKGSVYDAAGKMVGEQDNILGHQFLCSRPAGAPGEVWRVRLAKPSRGVLEDHYLMLQGIAPILATTPQALLKPVTKGKIAAGK